MMNLFRCIIQALNLPTSHQPIHQPTLSPKTTPVPISTSSLPHKTSTEFSQLSPIPVAYTSTTSNRYRIHSKHCPIFSVDSISVHESCRWSGERKVLFFGSVQYMFRDLGLLEVRWNKGKLGLHRALSCDIPAGKRKGWMRVSSGSL